MLDSSTVAPGLPLVGLELAAAVGTDNRNFEGRLLVLQSKYKLLELVDALVLPTNQGYELLP